MQKWAVYYDPTCKGSVLVETEEDNDGRVTNYYVRINKLPRPTGFLFHAVTE